MFDEALGGEFGGAVVAAREAVAAEVQLAGNADRYRTQRGVEHLHLDPVQRPADRRQVRVVRRIAAQRVVGDLVRLGGTVLVLQQQPGHRRAERADVFGDAQLLAGGHHHAQGAGAYAQGVGGLGEALQGDEGQQHALDLAAFEDMQQRGGVHPLAVGDELQLAAAAQRGEDLLEGHVEAQRRELQGAQPRYAAGDAQLPLGVVGPHPVAKLDALRPPGGTGGEQQHGQLVELRRGEGLGLDVGDQFLYRQHPFRRGDMGVLGMRDHPERLCGLQDQCQALRGIADVQRHADQAGAQDAPDRRDHLRRTVQRHSDRIAAARAGADQAGGHAARHMVEVAIGPALLLEGQRGAARQRLDLAFEQADDVDQRLGLGSGVAARGEEGEVGADIGETERLVEFDAVEQHYPAVDQRGVA